MNLNREDLDYLELNCNTELTTLTEKNEIIDDEIVGINDITNDTEKLLKKTIEIK